MSLFPRSNSREKIILPIRTNLKTYNEIPEHTIISTNTNLPAELDGETVIARYRNLTINAGCTLTPTVRCCGMVLIVDGDLTVNGTISMTARGANYQPPSDYRVKNILLPGNNIVYEIDIPASADEIAAFLKKEKTRYHSLSELPAIYRPTLYTSSPRGYLYTSSDLCTIPAVGGIGGERKTTAGGGSNGVNGINRQCGGGGAGGKYDSKSYVSGAGSNGTCYSGGSGGGGCTYASGTDAGLYGGAGGLGANSISYPAGGGAGNPGGAGSTTATRGQDGTGGLMIIICTGSVVINDTGILEAKGAKGGGATVCYGSGGGSGGGSINIFYNNEYINNGITSTAGGARGNYNYHGGGNGGDGCITLDKYNF